MRPNSGKKGSRGNKGSKKEAKFQAKRGGKPTHGGKGGRGGNKAGGRPSRPLSIETGSRKNKLSGLRKGDLSGRDLRFAPVVFVKAVDEFELTLETKPEDEDSEELEPVKEPSPINCSNNNGRESLDVSADSTPTMRTPEAAEVENVSEGAREPFVQNSASDKAGLEQEFSPIPEANRESESSDSDFEQIDAKLEAQFNGSEEDIYDSHPRNSIEADQRLDELSAFDESVSKLAIDTSSDSDTGSPFEYDQYNASQVDESLFESLSDDEGQFNDLTYDDFDFSDLRAGDDNDAEDDEDHMEELDDDQIFALASMATRRVNEYDDFDNSGFDKYDEFDEYFDQLLDRSTEAPPSTKQRASESRRLKHEARELLHQLNFGKSPILWQKYPEEIGVREVLEEIRHFAAQKDFSSLSFPPLDTNANWYVKQFAREHGLRPSVQGHHTGKHVICYLTNRATPNGGKAVNKLLNRRKYFRRVDRVPLEGKKKSHTPGAKVRDGHVVGQHASEITNENFGHRLMRQMGWSEGSGLGKGSAGIIAPIPATVKLTKTGLGA